MSKTVLFFGNERLVSGLPSTDTPVLRGLIQEGYTIAAVVSHHSETQSKKSRPLEVAAIAEKHGIPVLLPNKPADIYDELAKFNADIAVLSSYGRIISQEVIDLFPFGIVNIHPSLLPKYRGPTPIESVILNGDFVAGVSIMALSAGMDEGPLYAQKSVMLSGDEDKFELYDKLSGIGSELLLDVLPSILSGDLLPQPQEGDVSYSELFKKEDALVDPATMTADEIERHVRACLVFPKTKMTFAGHSVIVTKAHVADEPSTFTIECDNDSLLAIDELVGPSGKTMSAQAFLNGYATGA